MQASSGEEHATGTLRGPRAASSPAGLSKSGSPELRTTHAVSCPVLQTSDMPRVPAAAVPERPVTQPFTRDTEAAAYLAVSKR